MIQGTRVKSNQLAEKLCLGLRQMVTPGSHKCHAWHSPARKCTHLASLKQDFGMMTGQIISQSPPPRWHSAMPQRWSYPGLNVYKKLLLDHFIKASNQPSPGVNIITKTEWRSRYTIKPMKWRGIVSRVTPNVVLARRDIKINKWWMTMTCKYDN